MLTEKKIEAYTIEELQEVWNAIGRCFEQGRTLALTVKYGFGFLQLSRETARRGLTLGKGRSGGIILEKAEQPFQIMHNEKSQLG